MQWTAIYRREIVNPFYKGKGPLAIRKSMEKIKGQGRKTAEKIARDMSPAGYQFIKVALQKKPT